MKIKYSIPVVLIFLEAVIFSGCCLTLLSLGVHWKEMDYAWYEWKMNPTPETENKWKHERNITDMHNLIIELLSKRIQLGIITLCNRPSLGWSDSKFNNF